MLTNFSFNDLSFVQMANLKVPSNIFINFKKSIKFLVKIIVSDHRSERVFPTHLRICYIDLMIMYGYYHHQINITKKFSLWNFCNVFVQ